MLVMLGFGVIFFPVTASVSRIADLVLGKLWVSMQFC